jgi:predicted dehydrogenase
VKGVAEPRPLRRQRVAQAFDIPDKYTVADWRALAELPKFADAVVICTLVSVAIFLLHISSLIKQDRQHLEAVEAFAALGYDILCEK